MIENETITVQRIRDNKYEWNWSSTSDENLKIIRLIVRIFLANKYRINYSFPTDLANYHSIPATGPLENLYHRSEAATGIDPVYNRNSLTKQQSALKRFRWSRDEPQFRWVTEEPRGNGRRKSPEWRSLRHCPRYHD